jgi:xylan 1,4-beta-xylosidase
VGELPATRTATARWAARRCSNPSNGPPTAGSRPRAATCHRRWRCRRKAAPADSSPLAFIVGDRGYKASVTLEICGAGHGGLLLHYNEHMFIGVGFSATHMLTYNDAREQSWMREAVKASRVRIRVRNDQHIVTFFYALNDGDWIQHPWQMETSGMHQKVFGGFLSLQAAVYSAGEGAVHVRCFQYRTLA